MDIKVGHSVCSMNIQLLELLLTILGEFVLKKCINYSTNLVVYEFIRVAMIVILKNQEGEQWKYIKRNEPDIPLDVNV